MNSNYWMPCLGLVAVGQVLTFAVSGCAGTQRANSLEASIKNAYMMHKQGGDRFDPPAPQRRTFIETEYGKERFVSDLQSVVGSKYTAEAVYGLAWFGDDRHIPVVARELERSRERERIALFAMCQLSGRDFASSQEALDWWQKNRQRYEVSSLGRR